MNPQWNMCTKGRRQSPINVEPDRLLFDPFLRSLHVDKHKVKYYLITINTLFPHVLLKYLQEFEIQ